VGGSDDTSQEGGGERGETHVDSRSAVVERGRCGVVKGKGMVMLRSKNECGKG
jgi:hypothetical protein